jgi:ectoine hydroxylase-related dioxygenase (phytanoyl-CoA dioxygenase family)
MTGSAPHPAAPPGPGAHPCVTTATAGELSPPDDAFELAPAVVDGFGADGHALVRGLASPGEAAAYHPVIEAAAIDGAWNKHEIKERGSYDRVFLQSFNLWRVDPRIEAFVCSRRFAGVAAALLGVDRVRLYHDQALCKGPNGGRTPWHQDQYYWPLDTDRTITMWMPLIDIPSEVGSMTFASGSHRLGDLRGKPIGKESDAEFGALIDERGLPTHTHGAMTAGDATFHAGWTIHSAGRNPSDRLRTVMTVIYFADGARVLPEVTKAQEVDRNAWLGGRPLGAPADHWLNPVL